MSYYDLKLAQFAAPSLALEIASDLGKQIVAHHYKPGDLVEDEGSLAGKYQVSRSVIRDAVKILVGKGLLEVRRGIGTRVRPTSQWGLLDHDVMAWSQTAADTDKRLFKLLELRQAIEPKAAALAARHANEESISEIRHWLEEMEANAGSGEGFVKADAQFHRSILRATENEFFVALEGIILSTLISSMRLTNYPPGHRFKDVPTHRAIYEHIKQGDAEAAEKAMIASLEDAEANLMRCLAERSCDTPSSGQEGKSTLAR